MELRINRVRINRSRPVIQNLETYASSQFKWSFILSRHLAQLLSTQLCCKWMRSWKLLGSEKVLYLATDISRWSLCKMNCLFRSTPRRLRYYENIQWVLPEYHRSPSKNLYVTSNFDLNCVISGVFNRMQFLAKPCDLPFVPTFMSGVDILQLYQKSLDFHVMSILKVDESGWCVGFILLSDSNLLSMCIR